jgi:hypothetical protein
MTRSVETIKPGDRFYCLVTVAWELRPRGNRNVGMWRCACDCGGEIWAAPYQLRAGHTKSCGCLHGKRLIELNTKHGRTHTPEFATWSRMKRRCSNPRDIRFQHYGGRGIKVCERWRDSFENFHVDMGPRPSPEHSIDRINNDGDYEPDNCRWATRTEQARNTSNQKLYELHSESMALFDWCQRYGRTVRLVQNRLYKGWSLEEALTKPLWQPGASRKPPRPYPPRAKRDRLTVDRRA